MDTENSNDTRIQYVPIYCALALSRKAVFWGSALILPGVFSPREIKCPNSGPRFPYLERKVFQGMSVVTIF